MERVDEGRKEGGKEGRRGEIKRLRSPHLESNIKY